MGDEYDFLAEWSRERRRELDEALARIAALEAVLAFYADEARWHMNSSGITSALDDAGFRAREALTTTLAAVPMTGETK